MGKTFSALVDNTKGIHDSQYVSVFFRSTSVEIEKGLWPEAKRMYHSLLFKDAAGKKPIGKAHVNEKNKKITWPSGAVTHFAHLDTEAAANSWFGIEITRMYFEEFQFRKWDHFNVLRSRMRTMSSIPVGIRATCNPDPDHFARDFVERFLDDEGFPIQELSGKRAYFAIANDVLYTSWEESELLKEPAVLQAMEDVGSIIYEDAYSKFNRHFKGEGRKTYEEFVYGYFSRKELAEKVLAIKDPEKARITLAEMAREEAAKNAGPRSYTYIPATVKNNTELLRVNPGYLAELNSLPEKRRRALLEGCWNSTGESGIYFRRDWLKETHKYPLKSVAARGYDLASTEKRPSVDPDFTASVKMVKDSEGMYYLIGDYVPDFVQEDGKVTGRMRKLPGPRNKVMLQQAQHDGPKCKLVIPEDSAAAGKETFQNLVRYFTSAGFSVARDKAAHNASKLIKFEPFATAAEHGLVYIVKNTFSKETYEALMTELEIFDGVTKSGRKRKDDWVDSTATVFNYLSKEMVIPTFKLPDMSMANKFNQ